MFPKLTSDGFLEPYCGQVKRGGASDAIKDLVKRCLSVKTEDANSSRPSEDTIVFQHCTKKTRASVIQTDATNASEVATQLSHFPGCGVVFLDLPKVKDMFIFF